MKTRSTLLFTFLMVFGFASQSLAQFTPEEIAEREKWEEFLITATLVGQKQQKSREAVTEP